MQAPNSETYLGCSGSEQPNSETLVLLVGCMSRTNTLPPLYSGPSTLRGSAGESLAVKRRLDFTSSLPVLHDYDPLGAPERKCARSLPSLDSSDESWSSEDDPYYVSPTSPNYVPSSPGYSM